MAPNTLVARTTFLARDAEGFQRLAQQLLRSAFGVDVGGIDEVDAFSDGVLHDAGDGVLLKIADLAPHFAGAAECHGAKTEFGDIEAGPAELSVAHGMDVL